MSANAKRVSARYTKEGGETSNRKLITRDFQNVLAIDVSELGDDEADSLQRHYEAYLSGLPTFQNYLDERGVGLKPKWRSFKVAGLTDVSVA
jgi:hypothetical protein